jgi:hypothetical protein
MRPLYGGTEGIREHVESHERLRELTELRHALDESVKLQSHYAGLLNRYDGGERLQFGSVQDWLDRLNICQLAPRAPLCKHWIL